MLALGRAREIHTGVIEQQGNVAHFLHMGRFRLCECHVFLHISNGGFKSDVIVYCP